MINACNLEDSPQSENETIIDLMRRTAEQFARSIALQPGCLPKPIPPQPLHGNELVWINQFFAAPAFRRAHVELFEIPDRFAVVHVVILPHLNDGAPIFGFDMIAGREQATGVFLDFSPVAAGRQALQLGQAVPQAVRNRFRHVRSAPEWGSIFSPEFLAIRPTCSEEIGLALAAAGDALLLYLNHLHFHPCDPKAANPLVVASHSAYAIAQRSNPHTFRMLARFVGDDQARAFIDHVLFPLPE